MADNDPNNDDFIEPGDDDDEIDFDDIELTPEQQASILRAVQTPAMQASLAKVVQLGVVQTGLADIQRKLAFSVSQPLVEMQRRVLGSFGADLVRTGVLTKAVVDSIDHNLVNRLAGANTQWLQQFGAINSDIFKTVALTQPRLDSIAKELAKNAQLVSASNVFMSDLVAQQAEMWKRIAPSLGRWRTIYYPPNLCDIEGLTREQIQEVAMVDGIALYGVPRQSVAEALIDAESASKRRDILGRRWEQIASDCREVIEGLDDDLHDFARLATGALDALDAGHVQAAQALSATVLDAFMRTKLEDDRAKYTPSRSGKRTTEAYDELNARKFIAYAPIWQAYQIYPTPDGDPVPTTFSRHASAHTVSRRQFNRRNAVQAIMLACSLLYHRDERSIYAA